MLSKQHLPLIIGAGAVALVAIIWYVTKKRKTEHKEGYCTCTKCASWGLKTHSDRPMLKKLYREGIATENTIPQDLTANWNGAAPWNSFYVYSKNAGEKTCCGHGWS